VYIPSQWGVCAPSSCNADGVKIVADFNIGLFFSALNMDVTTKVAEPSCHFEGDGKKDLTVGAWLFMCVYQFVRCANTLHDFFQNLHTLFDFSSIRHYYRGIHVA
jgi:hypothetical protein